MSGVHTKPAGPGLSVDDDAPAPKRVVSGSRRGRLLLIAGVAIVVLAAIFRLAIVPGMLKLPTNLDATGHFAGEQLVFVDPASGAALPKPKSLPLKITRHIQADAGESSGSRIVLVEDVTAEVEGAEPQRQRNRYVMDRNNAVNIDDPRAYAFTPDNRVNRGGMYRLAFGFDVPQGEPIKLYSNDTDSTYEATSDTKAPIGEVEGHSVFNYNVRQQPHALSPVYLAGLQAAVGLPQRTTLAELAPGLKRAGVDIAAVTAALPPSDQAQLAQLRDQPVPLLYEESLRSRIAIEPKTGSLANLFNERITVTVRPDPNALQPLVAILNRNQTVPAVASALPKLQAASSQAQPVFALNYRQTPASVEEIGGDIGSALTMLSVAKLWLPLILVALGLGLVVLGARRARRA